MAAKKSRGVTRRLIAIPRHTALAGKNIVKETLSTASNVIGRTIDGVVRIGNTTTGHLNTGVKELVNMKRAGRKMRKTRKMRR